jgi:hypothetical protein
MYRADLSPIDERGLPPNCRAVGWLSHGFPFPTGPTSEVFRQRLQDLCWLPIRLMRGFHECEFCSGKSATGNGEIEVSGPSGEVYIAPTMVSHYVESHEYLPPDAFIEAVERLPRHEWPNTVHELSDRVRAVADNRTAENWDGFISTFLKSRVSVRASAAREDRVALKTHEDYKLIVSGREIGLSRLIRVGPDGRPELALHNNRVDFQIQHELSVVADFENQAREDTAEFVEFAASDLVGPAAAKGASIGISTSPPGHPSFLRISEAEVALLSKSSRPRV